MTRRVNNQTYGEWRAEYLATHNLTLPMDADTKRKTLYAACPNGFLPSADQQRWSAFVGMDRGADQREGLVLLADPTTGKPQVEEYVQLAFDDFREVCVRRARFAAVDIAHIRAMAEVWAASHANVIADLDAFMDDVKQAAGL